MTFWRVHSAARSQRVAIEGLFSGSSAFLIGGNPLLLNLDLRLLKMQGCWSMAINNAAVVVEPNAFICIDAPSCFNWQIFTNPRIMKLFNYSQHASIVSGKRLCRYPNTLFFDTDDESGMKMSELCKLEGPLPSWGNTFYAALACLYQLGFTNVFLIGCVFEIKDTVYAHGRDIGEDDKAYNKKSYSDVVSYLRDLMPMLKDENFNVMTCHENTSLDGICEYMPFVEAVEYCTRGSTAIEFNDFRHVNKS